ncbi:beta-ketoacyl-[acyl-carrier-protein] synthase family protein [Amycolatopsis sp. NPDC026612]|uniref:beta-ketoacyl-[acyl-carrier-protein] synthase family protein n=1 Tax=Amycolatopsis sp. NPDC026612 TaxID=3155466 RepID=UPI0033DDF366
MRRVVVTGIGPVTAVGTGVDAAWKALLAGHSGIGPIRRFDASSLRTRLAAEIDGFTAGDFLDRRSERKTTRVEHLAVGGAALAVADAGLDALDPARTALFTAGSKEVSDLTKLVDAVTGAIGEHGRFDVRRVGERSGTFPPLFYVEGLQGASLFYISAKWGLTGPNTYFAGTAEAGANAIGRAFRVIRRGEADRAIAGAADDPVWWWPMSSFDSLGLLSTDNDAGAAAFRPYDRRGSGAVLGEGAAFVLLEEYETAKRRGAPIYAEVVGYGTGADAHAGVTPHPDGRGLVHALRRALAEAGCAPGDVSYIASHGSATRLGDRSEARALRTVFGAAVPPASSVKPATGHLVGAAGALNFAVAALAVRHDVVPPTLNLEDPRPECALDWVPGTARELPVRYALAVARGLEGQNVVCALRSVAGGTNRD